MQAIARLSRRRKEDQNLDDNSTEAENIPDQFDQDHYHTSIAAASSLEIVSDRESADDKSSELYNELEDRLFIFPPPKFRKQDRQLRVLMSR
jgi:hypothetical protein